MSIPNLFTYATSELSQDAFICWLLEWAYPKNRMNDYSLHCCGTSLINSFFEKHKAAMPQIETIEVRKQDRHMDVLIVINDEFAIIVEDKTSTSHHGDQLRKYLEEVLGRGYAQKHVLPIYFKTHDQCSYDEVKKHGYQPFTRSDILKVLRPFADHSNAILRDYLISLEAHEKRVESFRSLPLDNWEPCSWVGFYMELGRQMDGESYWWGRVNNPSKPFWGFGWNWVSIAGYLLEEGKLTIKITETDPSKQSHIRNHWHRVAASVAQQNGVKLEKPKRFGKGKNMAVGQFSGEYRKTDENGLVDITATVAGLRQLEPLLDLIAKEANL